MSIDQLLRKVMLVIYCTLSLSTGTVLHSGHPTLYHNAFTMSGSSGSPVVNAAGQLIGLHSKKTLVGKEAVCRGVLAIVHKTLATLGEKGGR